MSAFGINVLDFGAKGDGITDDTAENRHCVQTDLDHGKEHAGIFLHIQK